METRDEVIGTEAPHDLLDHRSVRHDELIRAEMFEGILTNADGRGRNMARHLAAEKLHGVDHGERGLRRDRLRGHGHVQVAEEPRELPQHGHSISSARLGSTGPYSTSAAGRSLDTSMMGSTLATMSMERARSARATIWRRITTARSSKPRITGRYAAGTKLKERRSYVQR